MNRKLSANVDDILSLLKSSIDDVSHNSEDKIFKLLDGNGYLLLSIIHSEKYSFFLRSHAARVFFSYPVFYKDDIDSYIENIVEHCSAFIRLGVVYGLCYAERYCDLEFYFLNDTSSNVREEVEEILLDKEL